MIYVKVAIMKENVKTMRKGLKMRIKSPHFATSQNYYIWNQNYDCQVTLDKTQILLE